MEPFKFFNGKIVYSGMRWVNVNIHRYTFRIFTYQSDIVIYNELQRINRSFMTMFDDDLNRSRLLELLHERFTDVVNVLEHEEIIRNY